MNIQQLLDQLHRDGPEISWTPGVDGVLFGDGNRRIRRIGVTWMGGMEEIREAIRRECDVLLVHEPLFWTHPDESWESIADKTADLKIDLLAAGGLTVVRLHDFWDMMPQYGIPWAWGRFLGFDGGPDVMSDDGLHHLYSFDEERSLGDICRDIASRTARLGDPYLRLIGSPDTRIRRLGVGTGCIADWEVFLALGCESCIVTDDGSPFWSRIQKASDFCFPTIQVHHGIAEEPGIIELADWLVGGYPDINVVHIRRRPSYRYFGPGEHYP